MSREEAKKLKERAPYVHWATLNLTIDLDGNIQKVDFVERTEEEDFNQLFERWVRSTSVKWKVTNVPKGVGTLNIIIPLLQKNSSLHFRVLRLGWSYREISKISPKPFARQCSKLRCGKLSYFRWNDKCYISKLTLGTEAVMLMLKNSKPIER